MTVNNRFHHTTLEGNGEIMRMVFCRGCGKEIHETAAMCPHCGYHYSSDIIVGGNKSIWMAIVSSVLALLVFLNWFDVDNWDKDIVVGAWLFVVVSITLSAISLSRNHGGRIFNYISLVVSGITILLLFGKM